MLFDIGDEIRLERKRRKISQTTMSRDLGMSQSTISQIETGVVQEIGIRKLIRIMEYLGLELRVRPAGAPPTLEELREDDMQHNQRLSRRR
ncbi:MAG: helix-turn-helix transcriptional regulator [Desulfuromonas sp.]|jgi:transcriptional regulator with XRE-family HTH domain|nr:helix-turn-helix transcriptional regulator [Desulfuromonas sp.]